MTSPANSLTQIGLAVRIRRWRALGLPLDEIRQMIDRPDRAKEVLSRHEQRLNAEIEDRLQSPLSLRTCLQKNSMEYRTEQLSARQILSIRRRLQPPHYGVIPEALRDLMMHAGLPSRSSELLRA